MTRLFCSHWCGDFCTAVRLAFNIGPAIKGEQFTHDHPHPLWVGVSSALVMVNDGANTAAKNDVASHAAVGTRDGYTAAFSFTSLDTGHLQIF